MLPALYASKRSQDKESRSSTLSMERNYSSVVALVEKATEAMDVQVTRGEILKLAVCVKGGEDFQVSSSFPWKQYRKINLEVSSQAVQVYTHEHSRARRSRFDSRCVRSSSASPDR